MAMFHEKYLSIKMLPIEGKVLARDALTPLLATASLTHLVPGTGVSSTSEGSASQLDITLCGLTQTFLR